jgi:DNA-binding transcriptional MocR family regulator
MAQKAKSARHVRLYHFITGCPAWRDLDAVARAIYIDIARRYAGMNNGRIPYSVREAAAELKISTATASRALAKLTDHGFIVPVVKGAFSLKKRHATEWRLTEFACNVTNAAVPTKDFMRWSPASPLATALPTGALRGLASLRIVPSPGKLEVCL